MAISSCPRCTQQVTLPVGVSTHAQVRCPLCRAEYTLADALVNMPPLLEVVADGHEMDPDWFDMPSGQRDDEPPSAVQEIPRHAADELNLAPDVTEPAETSDENEPADELKFEAVEIEHDDDVMQQQDTEIEELALGTPDTIEPDLSRERDPFEVVGPSGEDVLDFNKPVEASAEGDLGLAQEPAAEGELEIDFGDALSIDKPAAEEEAEIDFAPPEATAEAKDEPEIDSGELEPAGASLEENLPSEPVALDDHVLDFGQPAGGPARDEEIELDFGEPVAAVEKPVDEGKASEEPASDKKSKKEKKKKLFKPPADAPRKRSLVGVLTNIVLPAVVAIPLALYGALWISPDYDFLSMGPKLAGYGLAPSSFNKRPIVAKALPTQPVQSLPQQPPAADAPTDEAPPPPDDATPNQTAVEPAGDASKASDTTEETKPEPAEPAPQSSSPPAPDANPPAKPAEDTPAEDTPEAATPVADSPETASPAKPAAVTPVPNAPESKPEAAPAEAKDDSLESLLKDDSAADAEKPQKMPSDKARVPDELPEPAAPETSDSINKTEQPPGLPDADEDKVPETAEGAKPAGKPAAPVEEVRPRDAREATPAELAKALQSFSQAREKLTAAQAANETDLKKVRMGYYLSLYGLADTLAFAKADPTDERLDAERQSAERLALELAGDAARRSELKSYGAKWLAFPNRTTPGIVLSGTVQSAEQIGKLYQVKIAMAADAPTVTVVSNFDPQLDRGDEVLALGSIVERPQEQLSGYEGTDAALVWSGMTLKVPSE